MASFQSPSRIEPSALVDYSYGGTLCLAKALFEALASLEPESTPVEVYARYLRSHVLAAEDFNAFSVTSQLDSHPSLAKKFYNRRRPQLEPRLFSFSSFSRKPQL